MSSIINEFLVESYDNLDQLDRNLVELEQFPTEKKLLGSIFRTIHTIKGTCGFLGYSKLESVAHIGENLLSRLRDGALTLSPEITSGLLAMVDAIRQILTSIESDNNEGIVDYTTLIETLTRLNKGERVAVEQTPSVAPAPAVQASAPVPAPASEPEKVAAPIVEAVQASSPAPAVMDEDHVKVEDKGGDDVVKERRTEGNRAGVAESSIRVDVSLLDRLMNLVGELVLARNQILQYTPPERDSTFIASTQTLNLITSELQEGVMKTRMQPIGNIWDKFPRVVRDLSLACGKQIRLEMEGKETELDKTLIEAIKDPLTHIVRNSVDHGIETPDKRTQKGKSAEGRLTLRAYHEGGQVNIEISDDGAGINPEKVKNKALEKNLITPEQAARMSDREMVTLIFLPGFSTA
ncbi:MAG: Hpt domain-containing protein, partial [Sideroxyarcus sp.]|nr:Hpt domain-containing protein [Sideroxyarcus sp.]